MATEPALEQKHPAAPTVSNARHGNGATWDTTLTQTDVVIIGAGLAGSLAALVLARRGKRVAIIDQHAIYPRDFRCEKLSPVQMSMMRELGVLDCLSDVTRQFDQILVARGGMSTGIQRQEERGLTYSDMVNRLRAVWPPEVRFLEGRVASVTTSPSRQRVSLANCIVDTRLIVLATGPRDKLPINLGFTRQSIRRTHSFCIGFGVAPAANSSFPFQSLTYFGEHAGDRMGYATFFPMLDGIRVNLFCYHEKHAAWINDFRCDPSAKLREAMPGLARLLGDYMISMPIEIRPIDLYQTTKCHRDGIVLIGDAFRTSCPATGLGVTRLLTDVRQLCLVHAPRWLASPGMDAGKIASFYSDPVKCNCDELSARAAERGRHLAIETGLRWRFERILLLLAGRFLVVRKLAALWRNSRSFMS